MEMRRPPGASDVGMGEAMRWAGWGRAGGTLLNTSPTSLTFSLSSTVLNPKCVVLPPESSENHRAGTLFTADKDTRQLSFIQLVASMPPLLNFDANPRLSHTRTTPPQHSFQLVVKGAKRSALVHSLQGWIVA